MQAQLWLCLALALSIVGCASSPPTALSTPPAPVATLPAPPGLGVAETPQNLPASTSAPIPTVTAPVVQATMPPPAPTRSALATATAPAPTRPAPALSEPGITARFELLSLPGVGRSPAGLAQLGQTLYAANRASDNIAVIRDRRVQSFIPTARSPVALAVDVPNNRLYATTYTTPTLSLIENDAVAKTIALAEPANTLALFQDKLLVGLDNGGLIEVRDPVTLEKKGEVQLSQSFGIVRLVVDAPRHRLYANVYDYVIVVDLDTLRELGSFKAPYLYGSLAINPVDGSIWGGIYDESTLKTYYVAFDQNGNVLKRVPLGGDLRQALFDTSGRIFVTDSFENRVDVVDAAGGRVLASVDVGVQPGSLWLDEPNHMLYVGNEESDSVSAIDTQTLSTVDTIPVGMDVKALLANQEQGRIYAANASNDSVYVIEGDRIAGRVTVGHHPVDLARDPQTNRLFVANYGDGAISVIDENTLKVLSTLPVTRSLSTVAVDAVNNRLFAGSTVFALDTLQPEGVYLARGYTLGSQASADFVRVNPERQKMYVVAYNGVPGSNSRMILYSFSETNLAESKALPYHNGGNITALAIDPSTQWVYAGVTHPLAHTNALDVWDADDNNVQELSMSASTSGLVVNPDTHHLFLAHANSWDPTHAGNPGDNTVQILDTRTLGEVGRLDVQGAPGPMARLGNTIYVAGQDDGAVTLIGDVATAQPPAPTPTRTPTPYPTWTPTSAAVIRPSNRSTPTAPAPPTPLAVSTPTAPAPLFVCSFDPGPPFLDKYNTVRDRLGCASGPSESGNFAFQPFQGGVMLDDLRDPHAQTIYVLFNTETYLRFPDTWTSNQPEDSCRGISPAFGLKPGRGFGKVWCEQAQVRNQLGGATQGETGVVVSIQRFQHGVIWYTSRPFAIFDDGTWQ